MHGWAKPKSRITLMWETALLMAFERDILLGGNSVQIYSRMHVLYSKVHTLTQAFPSCLSDFATIHWNSAYY